MTGSKQWELIRPVIDGRGLQIFIHHENVFDLLVRIHPATENDLITQYCDYYIASDVDRGNVNADVLLEICGRISGCIADLIAANIISKHGDLLRPG